MIPDLPSLALGLAVWMAAVLVNLDKDGAPVGQNAWLVNTCRHLVGAHEKKIWTPELRVTASATKHRVIGNRRLDTNGGNEEGAHDELDALWRKRVACGAKLDAGTLASF